VWTVSSWRKLCLLQVLNEERDVGGLDRGDLFDAVRLTSGREAPHCIEVRLARVLVLDLGKEEFTNAPGAYGFPLKDWGTFNTG
jgi:hypothetical protein